MKSVYIIGGDGLIERMMVQKGYGIAFNAKDADILIWTGGADVSPELYGHAKHPTTGSDWNRDVKEKRIYDEARADQLKVGICRGSQFLCVMNGGSLYQDVDRHAIWGTHPCYYEDGVGGSNRYEVTSTHHQMQNPSTSKSKFEIWGTANLSSYRDTEKLVQQRIDWGTHTDVEIVFWPETNTLGFQGHPEYDSKECRELFFICLDRAISRMEG